MSEQPKILFMPHANIQYCQLPQDKREWVIRESYGKLFDIIESDERYRIAFEASGKTVKDIAEKAPEVLAQLKRLIQAGRIEPVGSPFTHITISNIAPEIGLFTIKEGLDAWEKYLGVRPTTGWSPECSWASFVPDIYREAGFETFIMDADSFLLSFKEIREATGLSFDVKGHSNKNHLFKIEEFIQDKPKFLEFITNPSRMENGLNIVFRSDMMSNLMLWYLMGATEGYRAEQVNPAEIREMLCRWRTRVEAHGSYIMPYAEDAEYIGTSAYFYVKQFNQARFFEPAPESIPRFRNILDAALAAGYELSTPREIVKSAKRVIENPFIRNVENGVAWHGGTAKAWANTPQSRILDPVCASVFEGIQAVAAELKMDGKSLDPLLVQAMHAVSGSYVSDARWPPAPTSPGRFNVEEAMVDLYAANDFIRQAMVKHGIAEVRGLYSPELMKTQIDAINKELMEIRYFGE